MRFQLWALTNEGRICCFRFGEPAQATQKGDEMVNAGEWRTWDLFRTREGHHWSGEHVSSHCPQRPRRREERLDRPFPR